MDAFVVMSRLTCRKINTQQDGQEDMETRLKKKDFQKRTFNSKVEATKVTLITLFALFLYLKEEKKTGQRNLAFRK